MKQSFLLLTLLLPMLMRAGVIHHELDYKSDDLKVETIEVDDAAYASVEYPGLYNGNNPGEASLPCQHIAFALPLGACDIQLSAINKDGGSSIVLEHQIMPTQEDRIYDLSPKGSDVPEFIKNVSKEFETVKVQHVENYKDLRKIVYITVCPFEYDIDSWKLKSYDKISFDIEYSEGEIPQNNPFGGWNENYYNSKYYIQDLELLKSLVSNPESIVIPEITEEQSNSVQTRSSGTYGDAYEYTIVTNQELAPHFLRLVALKRIQGLDAGIALIEDILSNPSFANGDPYSSLNDDAAKLKAYFVANQNVIRYALLGGKPPIIPVRYGYQYYKSDTCQNIVPSDLYYGTGSSSDWGYQFNGIYGKKNSNFSYSTNIYIGRLLCKNGDDVENYLDKVEIYEHNPGFGNTSYLKSAYAHFSNGVSYLDRVREAICSFFSNCDTSNYHTGNYIINDISQEQRAVWNIHGHGNPEGIATWYNAPNGKTYGINALDNEYVWQADELFNGIDCIDNFGFPNLFYAASCSTAPFDSPKFSNYGHFDSHYDVLSLNLAESFTMGSNYGGIAYIGNTRTIYSSCDNLFNALFFEEASNPTSKRIVGNILFNNISNSECSRESHGDKIGHTLIGDPSITIWKGDTLPTSMSNMIRYGTLPNSNAPLLSPYVEGCMCDVNGNITRPYIPKVLGKYTIPENPQNMVISLKEDNSIPFIGNFNIQGSVSITTSNYVYVNYATIGEDRSTNKITFQNNVNYTIDASKSVTLKPNIELKPNATLTIWTPDTCRISNLTYYLGSKLIVHANTVIFTSIPSGNSHVEVHPYDKYGQNNQAAPIIMRDETNEYIPLLEEGKTWKYNMMGTRFDGVPACPDYPMSITLGEKGLVGDWEGYPVISNDKRYIEIGCDTIAYLREDTDEQKVWFTRDLDINLGMDYDPIVTYFWSYMAWEFDNIVEGKENILLYDFKDLMEGYATTECNQIGSIAIEAYGEELPATVFKGFGGNFAVAKGIGCLPVSFGDDWPAPCTVLGEYVCPYSDAFTFQYPYLYEVCLGDGTVVYYDKQYDPDFNGKADNTAKLKIHQTTDGILISGAQSNEAIVYNMQGMKMSTAPITNGNALIPTSSLPKGVYLLSIDGQSFKIKN